MTVVALLRQTTAATVIAPPLFAALAIGADARSAGGSGLGIGWVALHRGSVVAGNGGDGEVK